MKGIGFDFIIPIWTGFTGLSGFFIAGFQPPAYRVFGPEG